MPFTARGIILTPMNANQYRLLFAFALLILIPALAMVCLFLVNCRRQLQKELTQARKYLVETEQTALLFRMVAGITHDINSNAGVIISAFSFLKEKNAELAKAFTADTLTKSALEEHIRVEEETVRIVSVNLDKIADLVKSFKRLSVDQANEEIETFNVHEYIRQILVSLNPKIRKSSIEVRVLGDRTINLTAWPGAFSQVLTNLLDNALTHAFSGRESGEIVIETRAENGELILMVSDNGIGMSETVREKIFTPFFTTRQSEGGTGLGLFVVSMLINNSLGGNIKVESRIGEGSRFIVRIPLGGNTRSLRNDA